MSIPTKYYEGDKRPTARTVGRIKVTWYVLPLTKTRVEFLVCAKANTPGKVVDMLCGVRASKKVAGAGRKAPRGQHGRAKRSSSRAKRANAKLTD